MEQNLKDTLTRMLERDEVITLEHPAAAYVLLFKGEGEQRVQIGNVKWANLKTREYIQVLPDVGTVEGTFDSMALRD